MSADKLPDISESGGPHNGRVVPHEAPRVNVPHLGGRVSAWAAIKPASEFLSATDAEADFLVPGVVARGSLTLFVSPRGLGKTHVAHALAVELARDGQRVLIYDRDNSLGELRRRLRAWGAEELSTLSIITRDDAPPLTDRKAWAGFPPKHDLVVIDSLDSSTEGVGEQDSAKPALAMATLLDIVHTAGGPAVLVLGNTVKSGAHGRGSGVIEDRADIVFEVRDATNFTPSGTQDWWLELPASDRGSWADRATRRKKRDTYRLAFVPSKFRVGEEPDPFVLEVRLNTLPWERRDVTAEVKAAGAQAATEAARERDGRLDRAAKALREEVAKRAGGGNPIRRREGAEPFLKGEGLSRREARALITERTGADWWIEGGARKGAPEVLLPVAGEFVEVAGMEDNREPRQSRLGRGSIPAGRVDVGPPESPLVEPAQNGGGVEVAFRPRPSSNKDAGSPDPENPGAALVAREPEP